MSTAIVIGATGLVGKALVRQLLEDPRYTRVVTLVRRKSGVTHDALTEHVVDFDAPATYASLVKGDVLFSTMGTTRGQAGSIEAQRKVDYTYQLDAAKAAVANGVGTYVLVSSARAAATSRNAYLAMKGELERDVKMLGFSSVQILQPGLLAGTRDTPRFGEAVGHVVLGAFNAVGLFRSMRPITDEQVARAMRRAALQIGSTTHPPESLFTLAE